MSGLPPRLPASWRRSLRSSPARCITSTRSASSCGAARPAGSRRRRGLVPDDNSRLTVGYFYRDLPSGITDFNEGVAGTLLRDGANSSSSTADDQPTGAIHDYAQGFALDNGRAFGISRNLALPARHEFWLKKPAKADVAIATGTRPPTRAAGCSSRRLGSSGRRWKSRSTAGTEVHQPIGVLVHARPEHGQPRDQAHQGGQALRRRRAPSRCCGAASTALTSPTSRRIPGDRQGGRARTRPRGQPRSGTLTVMLTPPRGVAA